jgi:hypothetical protein
MQRQILRTQGVLGYTILEFDHGIDVARKQQSSAIETFDAISSPKMCMDVSSTCLNLFIFLFI